MRNDSLSIAALSLGGNLGDVAESFRYAVKRLNETPGVRLVAVSRVWRTPPWGNVHQPDFLNMAALVETTRSPRELLTVCQAIEAERDRVRGEHWGPRTLDIDVITFDDLRIDDPDLKIPHPRARDRAFVLAPLAEVAPNLRLNGESITELLARLPSADLGKCRPMTGD